MACQKKSTEHSTAMLCLGLTRKITHKMQSKQHTSYITSTCQPRSTVAILQVSEQTSNAVCAVSGEQSENTGDSLNLMRW